jgi:hypothetical protein
MARSVLCGAAALIFLVIFVTFPEFVVARVDAGGAVLPDAATAIAGSMRFVVLGLGLLAAGCMDWVWVSERFAQKSGS